jgi:hypothetical protein
MSEEPSELSPEQERAACARFFRNCLEYDKAEIPLLAARWRAEGDALVASLIEKRLSERLAMWALLDREEAALAAAVAGAAAETATGAAATAAGRTK